MKRTTVSIKNGKVTVEAEGFEALGCQAAHAPYVAALGVRPDQVTEELKLAAMEQLGTSVQEGTTGA